MRTIGKTKKGEYGYRNAHNKRQALLVCACLLLIGAQLFARTLTDNEAAKNILTVMAVVSVLPMANIASPFLVSLRYRSIDKALYEKAKQSGSGQKLFDLIVTTPKQVIPVDVAVVHPVGVFLYCSNPKLDLTQAEQWLNAAFRSHKLDENVKIFVSKEKFLRRLQSLKPAEGYEDDGSAAYAVSLLKSLSM
ncbi:MAG: O-linked GlcNAc transferase-like protein [bacterium]|nr:O-linked GlcNAc transferase-like protein [bacterium]